MVKRIDYLDYAKGISILLVVLGHIYSENGIKIWLYSFHLPLFFIVSGMLIKLKENRNGIPSKRGIIVNKIKSLMIPYFSFALLNFIFNIVTEYAGGKLTLAFIVQNLWQILILCGRGAIWFLPCLFIAELTFYELKINVSNNVIRNFIVVILVILSVIIPTTGNGLIRVLLRSFMALGFMTIGYNLFNIISNRDFKIIYIVVAIATNVILAFINGFVDLYSLTFSNVILYVFNSVLGSLCIIFLCKKINNFNILNFIGKNSLVIMGTHIILIKITAKIPMMLFQNSSNEYLVGLITLIIVTILELPVIFIFNKYLYLLIGRKTKYVDIKPRVIS